jgi:hypothetical protein
MDRKSSLIALGLIIAFLSAFALFTGAGISLAQSDLCSGYARECADRYASPGGNTPGAFSSGIVCPSGGGTASNSSWSSLYDRAFDWCAQEGVVH